jgi:hypothetical protein
MNHYYSNTNKSWYPDEDAKLINAYKYKPYTIVQLAHIHKRTPGNVMRRLKKLHIVKYTTEIRGYEDYRNSDLFYVLNPPETKEQPQEQNQEQLQSIAETEENESIYTNSEMPWSQDEDVKLFKLKDQTLQKLAQTLNRHPGDVAHHMKELKLVKALHLINGFTIYKSSPEYAIYQKANRKKKEPQPDTSPTAVFKAEIGELKSEVASLRDELIEMRESFSDLCTFIRSAFGSLPVTAFKSAVTKVYELNRNFK